MLDFATTLDYRTGKKFRGVFKFRAFRAWVAAEHENRTCGRLRMRMHTKEPRLINVNKMSLFQNDNPFGLSSKSTM